MADKTKIQWADSTFNPWIGCTKVSEGCKNCYAENTTRARVLRSQGNETWGRGAKRARTSANYWKQPLKWNSIASKDHAGIQRSRIFPSLGDWLDDEVPIRWLVDFLKLIYDTPSLDWLLLTKRPENALMRMTEAIGHDLRGEIHGRDFNDWLTRWANGKSPANIWIGTSTENQAVADKRIPELLRIPAAMRFVSAEPLLGPINIASWGWRNTGPNEPRINWVIIGGESGTNARPCNVGWIRAAVKECQEANVPVFVKQLGARPYEVCGPDSEPSEFYLRDKKGGDMAEWPEDLRVRQFPTGK